MAVAQLSPLLELPPEIRTSIYFNALVSDNATFNLINRDGDTSGQPSLLRTCHQIRAEATPLFYASNYFASHIKDTVVRKPYSGIPTKPKVKALIKRKAEALLGWLRSTPVVHINSIRGLSIRVAGTTRRTSGSTDRFLCGPLVAVVLERALTMDHWTGIKMTIPEEILDVKSSAAFRRELRVMELSLCGERVEQ